MLTLACTLLLVATPPSDPTPGAQIRRVDADAGVVVERRERRVRSTGAGVDVVITENVTTYADNADNAREDTFEIVRCPTNDKCPPIAQETFDEETRRERIAAPNDHRALLSLHVAAVPTAKNGASHVDAAATREARHKGRLLRLFAERRDGSSRDVAKHRVVMRVDLDDETQFSLEVPWVSGAADGAAAGAPHAWAQLYCGDVRCLVVAGWVNDAAPPADRRGLRIGVPFPFIYAPRANGLFPLEVLRVDARAAMVAYRQFVWAPISEYEPPGAAGYVVRELVVANAASGDSDEMELCRGHEHTDPPCTPKPEMLARENENVARLKASAKIASAHFEAARIGPAHAVVAKHQGRALRLEGRATTTAAAELWIDVDGERRLRVDVPWPTAEKKPADPHAWMDVHCDDAKCLVVMRSQERTGMGMTSLISFAQLSLAHGTLDTTAIARACEKGPTVSVVANELLLASEGERWKAALNRAGCRVSVVEKAKARRATSAVYAKDVRDAAAREIAHVLGVEVERLTWASSSPWVVALGG
jgi:hypothetical protein